MGTITVQELDDLGVVSVARVFSCLSTDGGILCPAVACAAKGRRWIRDAAGRGWRCDGCGLGVDDAHAAFVLARLAVGGGASIEAVLAECARRGLLPRAETERLATGTGDLDRWRPEPAADTGGPATPLNVLVVEDDADIAAEIEAVLSAEGYVVTRAENGVRALEALRRVPAPRMMLLDLLMPVMDGFHLLEELKSDAALRAVPVVIMTAARGVDVPGTEILRKPFDLERLLEVLRAHRP